MEEKTSPFDFMRRRREAGGPVPIVAAVVLLAAAGGGVAWWLMRDPAPPEPPVVAPAPTDTIPADSAAARAQALADATGPLPALDASDAFVRRVVGTLSAHPRLAEWLVTDGLVERFVDAVVSLAGGHSPSDHLEFMMPGQPMTVQIVGPATVIAPQSYQRFDVLTEVIASLDTAGSAALYQRLRPLFLEAYEELGIQGGNWDAEVRRASQNLLAAQIPAGPIEVWGESGFYEYVDIRLAGLSPAEKHILRLGPVNGPRVQAKIRELTQAIGL